MGAGRTNIAHGGTKYSNGVCTESVGVASAMAPADGRGTECENGVSAVAPPGGARPTTKPVDGRGCECENGVSAVAPPGGARPTTKPVDRRGTECENGVSAVASPGGARPTTTPVGAMADVVVVVVRRSNGSSLYSLKSMFISASAECSSRLVRWAMRTAAAAADSTANNSAEGLSLGSLPQIRLDKESPAAVSLAT
jgi:hypothetical protein